VRHTKSDNLTHTDRGRKAHGRGRTLQTTKQLGAASLLRGPGAAGVIHRLCAVLPCGLRRSASPSHAGFPPMSSKFHWGKDGKPSCGSNSQALAAGFFYDCAGGYFTDGGGERVTACGGCLLIAIGAAIRQIQTQEGEKQHADNRASLLLAMQEGSERQPHHARDTICCVRDSFRADQGIPRWCAPFDSPRVGQGQTRSRHR